MDDFSALIEALKVGGTPVFLVTAFLMWARMSATGPGRIRRALEDKLDAQGQRLEEKIDKQNNDLTAAIANQSLDLGSKIGGLSERVSALEGRVQGWMDRRPAPTGGANGETGDGDGHSSP